MTYMKCLVLVVMALVVIGCGTKDPLQPTQTRSYIMPLKVGNVWSYNMEFYNVPNQTPEITYDYVMTVIGTVTINSEIWYVTELSVASVPWADTVYFTNRSDGLYLRPTTAVSDSVYLRFKYPAQVGDSSSAVQEFLLIEFGFQSRPTELMSTNVSVTVPYDTLNCYLQYINLEPGAASPPYLNDYLRPNLGMVKSDLRVYYNGAYYSYVVWKLREVVLP